MTRDELLTLRTAVLADQAAAAMLEAGSINELRAWAASAAGRAGLLAVGLSRIVQPYLIGEGAVSQALGFPAGPVFVAGLKRAAETEPAQDADASELAMHAAYEQAWRLLQKGELDIGLQVTRTAFVAAVGGLPGFAQQVCDALLGMALQPVPVSDDDLNRLQHLED